MDTAAQQIVLAGFDGSLAACDDISPLIGTAQFNAPTGLARSWNYDDVDARQRSIAMLRTPATT